MWWRKKLVLFSIDLNENFTYLLNMMNSDRIIQISLELSDEQLVAISESIQVIACECPSYLIRLLQEVRSFWHYTNECIERFPEDIETHKFLSSRAKDMELLLSSTILEFLEKENLLDPNNHLNLDKLAQRTHELVVGNKLVC